MSVVEQSKLQLQGSYAAPTLPLEMVRSDKTMISVICMQPPSGSARMCASRPALANRVGQAGLQGVISQVCSSLAADLKQSQR